MKFAAFTLLMLIALATPASAIEVVCSVPDLTPIVKAVGGEIVNVTSVMPPGSDPHAFSISMETMERLGNADLIVLANSKLLHFEEKIKENYGEKCIDFEDYAAFGAKLDSFPGYDENPHGYWLKFENGVAIARAVEAKLSSILPEYAWYFEGNLEEFEKEVAEAKRIIRSAAAEQGIEGKACVAAVPGVCYIIQNSGMEVDAVLLAEGLGFVSGKDLAEIVEKLKSSEYVCIVVPEFMKNSKAGEIARQISADTGKPVIYVKFVMVGEDDSYTGLQYFNALRFSGLSYTKAEKSSGYTFITAVAACAVALAVLGRIRR
ncbi:metal ABC transporter substrate-binding protein [Archaeoglobus veneficus]|uniref:ABC-type metal ion transporter, periplasmic subunit n=1 Tax=Archaeoglobus veneficus (strain DSM 11195 / SNP6) TaxID=693661 RepID=F2KMY5_ARCVS|nr:zinc ABC transporter substrate-binding protein [Archaeoglobus veneficus]AEA47261.1 ABC-type metal ion transporter, periplasmic subunit [Archaeoglobus veneficus SNP6]